MYEQKIYNELYEEKSPQNLAYKQDSKNIKGESNNI